jgi:hypothetical protein
MKSNCKSQYFLPVVFVSLGGTKLKIGAITHDSQMLTEGEIHWRSVLDFAGCMNEERITGFCNALTRWVGAFLEKRRRVWSDVGLIGLGFPGPLTQGRWHSYNLTKAFESGVELEEEFMRAISGLTGGLTPLVRVAFDAQCDAGGELYHPLGRLNTALQKGRREEAVVINIATGIAAGFTRQGKVLITDEDFSNHIDSMYDSGAGQIGRHLWWHSEHGEWRYHYIPKGGVPNVTGAVRMTEYLSGPALAARLLWFLGHNNCLPHSHDWTHPLVTVQDVWDMWEKLREEPNMARRSQLLRQDVRPLSTILLAWADQMYRRGHLTESASLSVQNFAREIAGEFAAALQAWAAAPGWEPLLRHIVLTGGVGINFLASSDSDSPISFLNMLKSALPSGMTIQRSQLNDSAERGAYLFLHQAI